MPTSQAASEVQAVLFDYGLVLSAPPDPAAWAEMKRVLGNADEERFSAAYWRPRHAYDRGDLNGVTYWQAVAIELGHTMTDDEHTQLIDADTALWTQPNQAMIDWAQQLQDAGVKTGILSNIGDAMERGVLARCGWLENFVHRTFSHQLGIAKPEPAIYAHAAAGLGVPAQAVLFIDDREDNIEAARQAGMQSIQYSSHEAFLKAMHEGGYDALLAPATKV